MQADGGGWFGSGSAKQMLLAVRINEPQAANGNESLQYSSQ
jgi:hypothetical protein